MQHRAASPPRTAGALLAKWVVDEANMAREYERVGERAWREFEFGVTAD